MREEAGQPRQGLAPRSEPDLREPIDGPIWAVMGVCNTRAALLLGATAPHSAAVKF